MVRALRNKPEAQTSSEIVVRNATEADLVQIREIYTYYVNNSVVTFDLEPMSIDDWRTKLGYVTGLGLPFLIAASGSGQVLGFAYLGPWRQKAAYRRTVENSIYLRPAATGKRIGTKLMQALLDAGKAAGVKEVVAVISDRGAESSIALHNSFGFTTQGQLGKVGFKFGRWLGTILMQKSL